MTTRQLLLSLCALVGLALLTDAVNGAEPVTPTVSGHSPSEAEVLRILSELRSEMQENLRSSVDASLELARAPSQVTAD